MAEQGWNPLRVLNTSRPFTPLETGRKGRRHAASKAQFQHRDLPRLAIKESLEEESATEHGQKDGGLKLPNIDGAFSGKKIVIRKQFRATGNNGLPKQQLEDCATTSKQTDLCEADAEPWEISDSLLKTLLSRGNHDEEEDGSERVGLVVSRADRMLQTLWGRKQKVPQECFVTLSKLLFLLASDDDNDRFLCGTSLPAAFVEQVLGEMDLERDAEAVLNSYGALKLLTHNGDLLEALCCHGLVPLIILHLKVLCQEKGGVKLGKNIAFQTTACLRNCLNSQTGQEEFHASGGLAVLALVTDNFSASKEISCNLARLYSVLSQLPQVQHEFASKAVDALHRMTRDFPDSSELVVRTTFALGNVAAQDDSGRRVLLERPALLECLVNVLDKRATPQSRSANADRLSEDIMVKTVRVFANIAVLQQGGQWAATHDRLVKNLVRLLSLSRRDGDAGDAKVEATDREDFLVLSALSAVCNLSYYPIVRHCELFDSVICHVFNQDVAVAAEAARAIGNLSRIRAVRSQLGEADTLAKLMQVIDDNEDANDAAKRDLRFALVGTLLNVVADESLKEVFLSLNGFGLGMKWLLETRGSCDSSADWPQATLLCQLLWNALSSLPGSWRASLTHQVDELQDLLEEFILLDKEENGGADLQHSEFAIVSLQLLEKAASIATGENES